MVLHRSADFSKLGRLPQMISFVLPGRRTLSEHLPAEIIDVPSTLVRRSDYLCKVIAQGGSTYPATWQFALPNVDPMGFQICIEWLDSGHIDFSRFISTTSIGGILLRDAFDLIFAHIAGSQLEEPDFQDYIIGTMNRVLDVSQTPDLGVLEVVFLENGASSVLKQFVVDKMFAIERKMLGMMRGNVEDSGEGQRDIGCNYHVHAAGECYRDHLKRNLGNRAASRHVGHEQSYSNTIPGRNDRQRATYPSSSSSDSSTTSMYESWSTSMAGDQCFGSAGWSREVHGLQQRNVTPELHTNKPLPNIPPLKPGSSPTPPLSPSPFTTQQSQRHSKPEADDTQRLIFECLGRLRPTARHQGTRPDSELDVHRSQIPGLVIECLERFKNAHSANSSPGTAPSTRVSSPHPTLEHNHLPEIQERSLDTTSRTSLPYPLHEHSPLPIFQEQDPPNILLPDPIRQVHWEKSYDTLPKPWLEPNDQTATSPEPTWEPPTRQSAHDQTMSRLERVGSTHIKRKSAPPRGTDWLRQYDRINGLMTENASVVAKRSRRSRFKDMLRSESRLGGGRFEN